MVIGVFKAYVSELNFALGIYKVFCVGIVENLDVCINNFKKSFDACYSSLELLGEFNNLSDDFWRSVRPCESAGQPQCNLFCALYDTCEFKK